MPLEHSSSDAALKHNFHTLMGEIGKSPHVQSRKQAIAIALSTQRRGAKRDDGGAITVPDDLVDRLSNSWSGMTPSGRINADFHDIGGPGNVATGLGVAPNTHLTPEQGGQMLSGLLSRRPDNSVPFMPTNYKAGGIVPHFDDGGAVDPVTAVINALQTGNQQGGTSGSIGGSNVSAPSSITSTNATNPTAPQGFPSSASSGSSATTFVNPATRDQRAAQIASLTPATTPNVGLPIGGVRMNDPGPGLGPTGPQSPLIGTNNISNGVQPNPNATSQLPSGLVLPQGATADSQPTSTSRLSDGGVAPKLAMGGFNMSAPWFERQEARNLHIGPVLSNVPGRTDNHQVKVPAGSYVLPAQHVASMGQGNTIAGMSIASRMFGSGPYGTAPGKLGGHSNMPHPPKPMTFAYGGYSEGGARGMGHFEPVDVDISGGEFVIPPWAIIQRWGSLKKGHAALDKWIMETRAREIKTQKALPPPAKK